MYLPGCSGSVQATSFSLFDFDSGELFSTDNFSENFETI